jgi:hypothetical protein
MFATDEYCNSLLRARQNAITKAVSSFQEIYWNGIAKELGNIEKKVGKLTDAEIRQISQIRGDVEKMTSDIDDIANTDASIPSRINAIDKFGEAASELAETSYQFHYAKMGEEF